jgi:hypothetical protein
MFTRFSAPKKAKPSLAQADALHVQTLGIMTDKSSMSGDWSG